MNKKHVKVVAIILVASMIALPVLSILTMFN